MSYYKYIVLRGGGAKGFTHLGAIQELYKMGIFQNIEMIAGTSVGAIAAFIFSTGWPMEKIKETIFSVNLEKLTSSDSVMSSVPVLGSIIEPILEMSNFGHNYGIHKATGIYNWFKTIAKEVTGNELITFKEWHNLKVEHPELGLKDIIIEACNVNTQFNEIFSYTTENSDVPIVDAVRASMAIPFYFTPWQIKGCLYVDGGMQKSCPTEVFELEPGVPNPEAIVIWLDDYDNILYFEKGIKPPPTPINDHITFISTVVDLDEESYNLLKGPYRHKVIYCDTLKVTSLQFNLPDKTKQDLINSGAQGVISYFQEYHPELTRGYEGAALNVVGNTRSIHSLVR